MNNDINEAAKDASHMSEIAKKISIYDGIVNVISAWELVMLTAIVKCFKSCDIHDNTDQEQDQEDQSVNLDVNFIDTNREQYECYRNRERLKCNGILIISKA